MNVGAWLRGLGLERYAGAFHDHDVDAEVLPELTADDLTGLGITLVGHRRKLLAAIAALRAGPSTVVFPAPTPAPPTPRPSTAERRQLTVRFVDLVGSTSLSARLDPEDLREVIGVYHRRVAAEVERLGGFVAKYMGDGVLAYFGYPEAHEDDAEQAVRAGLELVAAVRALASPAGIVLRARVGVATGLAVVGDLLGSGAAQEQAVVGEMPNLAARLQALAEPDSVVIAAATRRLVGDLFECADLGAVEANGFALPVRAYRVLGAGAIESRFEALHAGAALEPLIGRGEELELLLRCWHQAKGGEGQVVLLSGEPGIGKSRLLAALQERLAAEPQVALRYFCAPHRQDSAFHPIIAQLGRAAMLGRSDPPPVRLAKLATLLARTQTPPEDVALLAELLSIPGGERYPAVAFTPQLKRERTFTALLGQLEGLARERMVLVTFEDVHWIDPSSRELLDLLVERIASLPVLLLVTFRPEFRTPWQGQPHVAELSLNRLDRCQATALVRRVARDLTLPEDLVAEIVERTDGVPLFVEELTKAVLEAETGEAAGRIAAGAAPAGLAVPATLHASLMARLDRLGPAARELAQVGAAIGREFDHALLAAVADRDEAALAAALDRLVGAGLVSRRGVPPEASYLFKHALVQDAAYGTLLRDRRRRLHGRIAHTLEERSPGLTGMAPELIARHLAEAGEAERAIPYWRRAGELAAGRSADVEAVAHLSAGLALTRTLPAARDLLEEELALCLAIGGPLIATRGYAAADVERTYSRAWALRDQLGRSAELFPVLRGLWHYNLVRGDLRLAHDLSARLVALAEEQGEPLRRALARRALGTSLFSLGRFADATAALDEGIAIDDAVAAWDDPAHLRLYTERAGVAGRLFSARALWFLGFPNRASATVDAGLALADRLAHPYSLAFALTWAAVLHAFRREFAAALRRADAAIGIAREYRMPIWRAQATMCRGFALVGHGRYDEGITALRTGLADWNGIGARFMETQWLGLMAEAHIRVHRFDHALAALDRATETAAATAECYYQAKLYRLRGVVLARTCREAEAAVLLQQAIDTAKGQQARSLELRAAATLARVWQGHGRHAQAHDLLAPVHGWFTEGFATADLRDAKALLDEPG